MEAKEEFDYITDKIPQRPVGIVEGTSYSIIIIAALGVRRHAVGWGLGPASSTASVCPRRRCMRGAAQRERWASGPRSAAPSSSSPTHPDLSSKSIPSLLPSLPRQFAAAVLYAAVSELLLQPAEYVAYNKTLERVKDDPRVTVRLGEPVHAYGTESRNRAARQRIPHRLYSDPEGRQHVQVRRAGHGIGSWNAGAGTGRNFFVGERRAGVGWQPNLLGPRPLTAPLSKSPPPTPPRSSAQTHTLTRTHPADPVPLDGPQR